MATAFPLRTELPTRVMGLLRAEGGSRHTANLLSVPELPRLLDKLSDDLLIVHKSELRKHKDEIASALDAVEQAADTSLHTEPSPEPVQFVPDPSASPEVNRLRAESFRVEQEISQLQEQLGMSSR